MKHDDLFEYFAGSPNAQKYHRMYLNSRNSLRSPGFYQFSGRQQAFWLQNEEYATPPIEIQQNHQTYRNSKIEKSKLKDPGLNNVNYAVQEPVRIFLERLHPQRKTNRCSNSAFLNGKNIDKSIKNVNDGSPIRKSTQQTLNQSSTDEVLPTRNATEISLKQSNLIAISYVEKETDLSQRLNVNENPLTSEFFNATKNNESDSLHIGNPRNMDKEFCSGNDSTTPQNCNVHLIPNDVPNKNMLSSIFHNELHEEKMKGPSIATAKHNFDSPWRYQNLSSPKSSLAERMNLNEKLATAKNSKTTEDLEKNDTRIQGLQQAPHSALIYSIFPKVPPCLRFSEGNDKIELLPWEFRKLLHWRQSLVTPTVVRQALARAHFRTSTLTADTDDLDTAESRDWIYYFGKHLKPDVFLSIRDYQKVNHLPCSFHLGRKDRLWRNISIMQKKFGAENFNFVPLTFCMPTDFEKFKLEWDTEGTEHQWILKPPASARGLGVRVVNKWSQIPKKRPLIVQRYLSNPYLINNSKFDLRIYVFVYSIHPLIVFVHEDGLVRFASHKYTNSPRFVGNRYVHLTNYSINRQNVDYISNTSGETCTGHKWSLRAFWPYLRSHNVQPEPVWNSIKDVIAKTCIAIEPQMKTAVDTYCKSPYSVQELFGFDIFLDANLKPWLLEVNVSPSMHIDSPLDTKVKGTMIKDMLNLTGINLPSSKDVSGGTSKSLNMATEWEIRLPPHQHLNVSRDMDTVRSITQQTILQASNDTPPPAAENETKKWIKEMEKPPAPPNPWVMDRRMTMSKLGDDERRKHEYYVLRACEVHSSKSLKLNRPPKCVEPPPPNIEPEILLDLEPLSAPTTLDKPTLQPSCVSHGAGPDSLDLAAFMKFREDHKRAVEQRRLGRRQLLQRISTHALGECEDEWKGMGNQVSSTKEDNSSKAAVGSESKATKCSSLLERYRWVVKDIFNFITPFDLRCLVQLLDTRNRAGSFQPVFPSDNSDTTASYLQFFDKQRYANLLIFAYLDKYGISKEGTAMLSELCEKEVHLKSRFFGDELDDSNIWKPPLQSSPPPIPPNTKNGYDENRIKKHVTLS